MTREAFEQHVSDALATIPKRFREAMRNIVIVVEDEPSPALLREMQINPPDTLFGLYQGVPLTELPGVGRKTANVVLGHALGVPGLPVDRHVLRVSNRIGIAEGDHPEVVEEQLCSKLPKLQWTRASDTLILHGRRICRPKPLCPECVVQDDCEYFHALQRVERRGSPARLKVKPPRKAAKWTKPKPPGRKR